MRFPLLDTSPRDSHEHMLMQMHMAVFTDKLFIKEKREKKTYAFENEWIPLQQLKSFINWDLSYKYNVILMEAMS